MATHESGSKLSSDAESASALIVDLANLQPPELREINHGAKTVSDYTERNGHS